VIKTVYGRSVSGVACMDAMEMMSVTSSQLANDSARYNVSILKLILK